MTYRQFVLAAVVTLLLTACGRSAEPEQTAPEPTTTSAPSNAPVTAPKSTEVPVSTAVLVLQPTTQPPDPASVATEVGQQAPEPTATTAPSNAPVTAPIPTDVPVPTTDPATVPPTQAPTQAAAEPTDVDMAIPVEGVDPQATESTSAYTHTEDGVASYLSDVLHGAATASGEIYNKDEYVAAHKDLAFGTKVLVTNLHNGKSVIVTVIDRMPYNNPHLIDVSGVAAVELEMLDAGNIDARVEWNE